MKNPLSFIIVGSGWRAMFYARIAKRNPQRFHLNYILCRRKDEAWRMVEGEDLPGTTSAEQCEESGPDFVVVAVNKTSIFQVTKEWALKGFPVLCETPAGMNLEELRQLWKLKEAGYRIQVAEQYIRYPIIAAGLKAIGQGKIGTPYSVNLSVAHDYHGVSLIRHILGVKFEPVTMWGHQYAFPVRETDSRYGAVTDGSVKERERTCVTMEFASGKIAYYDFSGVQYHSFIRSRHLQVQGQDGEWKDTVLKFIDEDYVPRQEKILPYLSHKYRELETEELKKIAGQWNQALELETAQDEYAMASMLADMGNYLETGKEIYPLSEALEDVYLWLLMERAAQNPGSAVKWQPQPWIKEQPL